MVREGQSLPVNDGIIKYYSTQVWIAEYIRLAKQAKSACDLVRRLAINKQSE